MRKNFIKGLALAMAICMGVVGCGTNSSSSDAGTTAGGNDETQGTTAGGDVTTTEGEVELYPAYDFGGQTFTILNSNDFTGKNPANVTDDEFAKEERQAHIDYIQEKYNCVLEFVDPPAAEWSEIPTELVSAYTAGKPVADIMDVYYNYLAPLVINDVLLDMTEYFESDSTYKTTNVLSFLGKNYGICSAIAGEGLYYNKDMIADAGMEYTPAEMFAMGKWDYDSMYEYLVELKAGMGGGDDVYPIFIYPYYWALFASSANGVTLLGDDGNLCYISDEFIETIEFAYKCISEGLSYIPLTDTGSYNNWGAAGETFDKGEKVAIAHRAAWQAAGLVETFDLGFVPYPWGIGVTIDESKIGEMDAYKTLEGYMQTYYDGQVISFINGIEERANPMELTSMMCEFMGWDSMLTAVDTTGATGVAWLEDGTIDEEVYMWTRTVEVWQYYNSIAGSLWESNLSFNSMLYQGAGIRTTLESAYQAEMQGIIEAGLATEDVLTPIEPAE